MRISAGKESWCRDGTKELTERVLEIFDCTSTGELGASLMNTVKENDTSKMASFVELMGGDLSKDWLQMVFQYYEADRKEKKQDYTPKCLAQFLSLLIGQSAETVDLCAGSGALTIQRWASDPETVFSCYEIDDKVLPYLLFNLAVRNISATVYHGDALQGGPYNVWKIERGERYGKVTY